MIAAALALSLLGEFPSSGTALGIAAATLGVMLAAGALDGWQPSRYRRSPTTA